METVFEKVQIKRKWGQYEAHHVNSSTPVRDRMIQWVGERRVTEEELKQYLTTIQEERGKNADMNWFTRNGRFFEQTTHRGQDVYTLSKYGKRVLEAIKCQKGEKDKKQINENWGTIQMKNLKTFKQFLNESSKINDFSVGDKIEVSAKEPIKELVGKKGTIIAIKKNSVYIDFGENMKLNLGTGNYHSHNLDGMIDTETGFVYSKTPWLLSKIDPRFDLRNIKKIT